MIPTLLRLSALLALVGLCHTAHATGSLVLDPAASSVTDGASFSVEVRGEAFTDRVVGGGFDFSFNPAVLMLESVVINTAVWEFSPSAGTIDNNAGTLTDVFFNTFAAAQPTGNFLVATLNFRAEAAGTSALTLLANSSFPFANHLAEVIEVSFGTGEVTVSAVPEPATWASMALGLALLPLLARGRRTRAS